MVVYLVYFWLVLDGMETRHKRRVWSAGGCGASSREESRRVFNLSWIPSGLVESRVLDCCH